MEIIDVHSKLPWSKSVGRRFLKDLKYVIVHHDASPVIGAYDPIKRYTQEANYHISKDWGHLAYHVKIAADGKVYQCVPLEEIGYQAGSWPHNKFGFAICLDGSFDKQKPTTAQINALQGLMEYYAHQRPDLPGITRASMFAHKEVRVLGTFCPGGEITKLIQDYRNAK